MTPFVKTMSAVAAWTGVAILLAGCGGRVPAPTSYTAYNAKDGSFQCDCPDGWNCEGGGKGHQWATFSSGGAQIDIETGVLGSALGDMYAARNAMMGDMVPDESMTPVAQVHEVEKKAFAEDRKDYQEQTPTTIKSGMGDVRKAEFTQSGTLGGKLHGYRATALASNVRVQIVCMCPESNWATLQPAFDRVIQSLRPGRRSQ